jgi:hypothetical protein
MRASVSDYNLIEEFQDRIEAVDKLVSLILHNHAQSKFHVFSAQGIAS